jgi:hypothetical protein
MLSPLKKLLRGGSWYSIPGDCRSAFRDRNEPDYAGINVGFRVVCLPRLSLPTVATNARFQIAATRVENRIPSAYRLMRTRSGDYYLEGLFTWTEGWKGGAEWRTVQTVAEDAPDDEPYGRVIS